MTEIGFYHLTRSKLQDALPKLLGLLNIRGALVSTDAMGCQTAVAEDILAGGGNYLFGLKGNQLGLDKEAKAAFAYALGPKPKSVDAARPLRLHKDPQGAAQNVGHGRIEERTAIVIRRSDDPELEKQGKAFLAGDRKRARRETKKNDG
jgi:hypothetical protein